MPAHVSRAASSLIEAMLIKDQRLRLGCGRSGFTAIKNHSWFRGLDWDRLLLKKLPAPIVPEIKHPLDASNFDVYDEEVCLLRVTACGPNGCACSALPAHTAGGNLRAVFVVDCWLSSASQLDEDTYDGTSTALDDIF